MFSNDYNLWSGLDINYQSVHQDQDEGDDIIQFLECSEQEDTIFEPRPPRPLSPTLHNAMYDWLQNVEEWEQTLVEIPCTTNTTETQTNPADIIIYQQPNTNKKAYKYKRGNYKKKMKTYAEIAKEREHTTS
jgi:hypothetical protein